MQVAFDVTPAISGGTGIARYVNELGAALERRGVELRRFAVGRAAHPAPAQTRRLPIPARVLERWWPALPEPTAERLVGGADLVHATGLIVPRTHRPLVVTVHDLAALRHPELHPARHVRQQRLLVSRLGRAAAVLAVSQATADDLVRLGIAAEQIVVSPLGVTALLAARPAGAEDPTMRPYVLAVGETSRRKRHALLLRALARLNGDLDLVVAGPPGAQDHALESLAAELGISPRVKRLRGVSDAALGAIYRGAVALCFPSVSEGFGLPVLEAMAVGLPVLASDIPTTREVAGDAAIYVTSDDERSWAEAIGAVASDVGLRASVAAAGKARAAQFRWERTAQATVEAYRLAVNMGR